MRCKNLSLVFSIIIFFMILVSFFSCAWVFPVANNRSADMAELHIRDIFQKNIIEDIIKLLELRGYNYNSSAVYSVLQEAFHDSSVRFFMLYSDDDTIQEAMKELAVIKSAEKAYSFAVKKSQEILTGNNANIANIEAIEKLFILSFSAKQLLINCVKNINPLREQIEQLIEEKTWDMEYQEEDSDLFFDIIELENGVTYLNRIRRTLLNNIAEISKTIDKTELYLKHHSD